MKNNIHCYLVTLNFDTKSDKKSMLILKNNIEITNSNKKSKSKE